MTLQPGTRIGNYEVLSELGSGGMGEVYKARDLKLGRVVAIKVLPQEMATNSQRLRRFEQEARAASALNHPNIVTIYEIGEHDGAPYISMEFVEGQTLREILTNAPLPNDKLVRYATQIAEGLAKAHQAGIVHRDLKPENIVVSSDGYAKILDFGLAKLLPKGDVGAEVSTLARGTAPGAILGTVGYMSPEQAKGEPADFRSDQFSFGAIVYEMATGKRAFQRETPVQTLTAIIEDDPEPVTLVNPKAGAGIARVIDRCLSKDPKERYDSTRDIARDTHWEELGVPPPKSQRHRLAAVGIVGILALVLVTILGLFVSDVREWVRGESGLPGIESLAVLPLENLSGDPEQEYFADGMTDELISQLAQIQSLRVISRTSIMQYKGARKSLPEIGRELDVDVVVEGTVRRAEGRVRITAQLVDASSDRHLWAQSFERELRDVLVLQSEMARAIAQRIEVTLTPQEALRLAASRPVDPEAHEAFLKGRYHLARMSVEDLRTSAGYLETAIALDPSYGEAYATLAVNYSLMPNLFMVEPEEGYTKAKELARDALALDDTLEDAHSALGWSLACYDYAWREAEEAFRRTIELAPNSALARSRFAWFLSWLGRHDEALRELRLALQLDPLSVIAGQTFAASLIAARRYEEAIEQATKTLELHPGDVFTHVRLGTAYALQGRHVEALEVLEEAARLTEDPVRPKDSIAWVNGLMGNHERARHLLEQLLATEARLTPFDLAGIYVALGDYDDAFELLEAAYTNHDPNLVLLKVWPSLDPIRDDPRFQDLLLRMNFPE